MSNSIKQLAEKYHKTLNFNQSHPYTMMTSEQYRELERVYRILNAIIELKLVDRIENKIIKEDQEYELLEARRQKELDKLVASGKLPF